jgi:hypothetical protein
LHLVRRVVGQAEAEPPVLGALVGENAVDLVSAGPSTEPIQTCGSQDVS